MRASVIVPARDAAATLDACIASIVASPLGDGELILCDDASGDATPGVIAAWVRRDPRIRSVRLAVNSGPAAARNAGIAVAAGKNLLFADADTIVGHGWVDAACAALETPGVVAVEGATYGRAASIRDRVAPNPFYPRRRDAAAWNTPGEDFGAANIAYRADVIARLGGFDARRYAHGREDTDLAFRAATLGRIAFAPGMQVDLEPSCWTWPRLRASADRYAYDVRFLMDHGRFPLAWGRIVHPLFLACLLVPVLLPFLLPPRSPRDLLFLPLVYAYLARLRWVIWRTGIRERFFIV